MTSVPVIAKQSLFAIYESSKEFFSKTFSDLLLNLATIVGDTEEMLFFIFLVVETMLFERFYSINFLILFLFIELMNSKNS